VNWRVRQRPGYRDAGKHRRADRGRRRDHAIPIVDARTLTAHRVTDEAFAAGRRPEGRYVALCGLDVLPASLTVAEVRHCRGCVAS
jgi:hypothetical protein